MVCWGRGIVKVWGKFFEGELGKFKLGSTRANLNHCWVIWFPFLSNPFTDRVVICDGLSLCVNFERATNPDHFCLGYDRHLLRI